MYVLVFLAWGPGQSIVGDGTKCLSSCGHTLPPRNNWTGTNVRNVCLTQKHVQSNFWILKIGKDKLLPKQYFFDKSWIERLILSPVHPDSPTANKNMAWAAWISGSRFWPWPCDRQDLRKATKQGDFKEFFPTQRLQELAQSERNHKRL